MSVAIQPGIEELLEQAGARPPRRGRGKWTCPECHRDTLSVNAQKQVFNCHHAGCEFRGGMGTLRKMLGIEREWLPRAEYEARRQRREQVDHAAERLYQTAKARRFELYDELRMLYQIEAEAHAAGPERAEVWDTLAHAYSRRPDVLAELAFLENSHATSLRRFLDATPEQQRAVRQAIIADGGLFDSNGKFVEVAPLERAAPF